MRLARGVFLVLGALPLLVYPFVLLANLMSLAGHRAGDEPIGLVVVVSAFLIGSTAYPAVYLPCLAFAIARGRAGNAWAALGFSVAPVVYLAMLLALGALWLAISP